MLQDHKVYMTIAFGMFGFLIIIGILSLVEVYLDNQIEIEAIKAGLVQNEDGNWVKSKE